MSGVTSLGSVPSAQTSVPLSKHLIQHSVLTTSSGQHFRIVTPQPALITGYADVVGRKRSRPTRRILDRPKRRRSDDEDDYQPDENDDETSGRQLRRSARKQRAARQDPDFVVDFDDDDDEDVDADDDSGAEEEDDSARDAGALGDDDDGEDSSDSGGYSHPRRSAYVVPHGRVCRIPQYDGAGDDSTEDDVCVDVHSDPANTCSLTGVKDAAVVSSDSFEPSQCPPTRDPVVFSRKSVVQLRSKSDSPGPRLLRVVRTLDNTEPLTSYMNVASVATTGAVNNHVSNVSEDYSIEIDGNNETAIPSLVVLRQPPSDGPQVESDTKTLTTPDGLRVTVSTAVVCDSPQPTESSNPPVVISTPICTTSSNPVFLPQGIRVLPASTTSTVLTTPLRLVDGKVVRATPTTNVPTSVTISRLPSTAPVSISGSNPVRLILSSAPNPENPNTMVLFTTSVQADTASTASTETTGDHSITTIPAAANVRHQPAILRRTLASVPSNLAQSTTPTEFKFFTIPPHTQSIASAVATSTARHMACLDVPFRSSPHVVTRPSSTVDSHVQQSRRSLAKSRDHPGTRTILPCETARTLVPIAPRILSKPGHINTNTTAIVQPPTLSIRQAAAPPSEAQLALDRAVTEASAKLQQAEAQVSAVKSQIAEIDRKLTTLRQELLHHQSIRALGQVSAAESYSLCSRSHQRSSGLSSSSSDSVEVVLPSSLPPINSYVWPPVHWPDDRKQRPSQSNLFRWHPGNLRAIILSAGRRELPGYDVEKKRLAQIVWPYPTAKPSMCETWRFRLSQLRLLPHTSTRHTSAGQDLASFALLLRTLWHCLRWDDLVGAPPEDDHCLDPQGRPCLREFTHVTASSGRTSKSAEQQAHRIRRIVGIQPLDKFWLRANYLVRLRHTRPLSLSSKGRSPSHRTSRSTITRSRKPSMSPIHEWSPNDSPQSSTRAKDNPIRRESGDPDYDPCKDECWRGRVPRSVIQPQKSISASANRRRSRGNGGGRRRRRRSDLEDDDDDEEDEDTGNTESDDVDDWSGGGSNVLSRSNRKPNNHSRPSLDTPPVVSLDVRVEEQWMTEKHLYLWEIRTFMNEYLPPGSEYPHVQTTCTNQDVVKTMATGQLRRPSKLVTSPSDSSHGLTKDENLDTVDDDLIVQPNDSNAMETDQLDGSTLCITVVDTQSKQHLPESVWNVQLQPQPSVATPSELTQSVNRQILAAVPPALAAVPPPPSAAPVVTNVSACSTTVAQARPISPSVLEAKSRARSLAAMRAAKASVHARKMKAERLCMEQYMRTVRSQFALRRRLHLQLAKLLAEDLLTSTVHNREIAEPSSPEAAPRPPPPPSPHDLTASRGRGRGRRRIGRPPLSSRNNLPRDTANASDDLVKSSRDSESDDHSSAWEEEENEPLWSPSSSRQRGACTAGRRARAKGRTRGRCARPLTPLATPMNAVPSRPSPLSNTPNDSSSGSSTPSTCPGLGDEKWERVLIPRSAEKLPRGTTTLRRTTRKRGIWSPSRRSFTTRAPDRGATTGAKREYRPPIALTLSPTHPTVAQSEPSSSDVFCVCKTPYDPTREYLGCDLCQDWFHFECVNLSPADAAKLGDSWHCPECKRAESRASDMVYCLCRTPYEPARVYIACDGCDEWYHAECVGLTSQQAANHQGTYICPSCTQSKAPTPEHRAHDAKTTSQSLKCSAVANDDADMLKVKVATIYETHLEEKQRTELIELVHTLKAHKMSWPLVHSPDPIKYPASVSLTTSRNLTKLMDALNTGTYRTLSDFSFAMNEIFTDARLIYPPDSAESHCTDVMETYYMEQMRHFKSRLESSSCT